MIIIDNINNNKNNMLHKIIVNQNTEHVIQYSHTLSGNTFEWWCMQITLSFFFFFFFFSLPNSVLERINLVKWIRLPSPNRMKLLVFGCIKLPQQFGGPTAQTSAFLAYSYLLRAAGPKRLNISHSLFTDTQAHTHSTRALFNLFELLKFWINPENSVHLWNLQFFLLIVYNEKI